MNPVSEQTAEQTRAQARHTAFQRTLLSARQTMMFSEILTIARDSFRASKTRFALTALGMVIGTASVILVVTIGLTGKQYVLELLQKIGTNQSSWNTRAAARPRRERVALQRLPHPRTTRRPSTSRCPASCTPRPCLRCTTASAFGGGVNKDTPVLGVNSAVPV